MSKLKYKINNQWVDLDFGAYITNAVINSEDHLMVTLSDNRCIDAGSLGRRTIDISKAVITLNENSYTYNGSSHLPSITGVTLNNQELELNTDYAIIVTSGEINAGQYILRIIGINNYSGIASTTWTIAKAQAMISGDDSLSIVGLNDAITATYTTNGDGQFEFIVTSSELEVKSSSGGTVELSGKSYGTHNMTVRTTEGQNYLSASKVVSVEVKEPITADVFGVMWDYSLSSPQLSRLTSQNDPYGFVTVAPGQEPTSCVGTTGGQSDFDNYLPWSGMIRKNYVNGEIVDFVSYENGETFVYIPKFWSKIVDDSVNSKMYFYISNQELNEFTEHQGSNRYIGRYVCGTDFKSMPNSAPNVDKTIAEYRTALHAKNANLYVYDIHTYNAIQLLYLVEYANLNSQNSIGMGVVSGSIKNSGTTDTLTYHTGRVDGTDNQSAIQYRWVENPWGNVWQFIDGVLVNDYDVYICNNANLYGDSLSENYIDTEAILPNAFGYVRTLTAYNNGYILPHYASGASDSTYVCDYYYGNTGLRDVLIGGATNNGTGAGLFFWSIYNDFSEHGNNLTARPMLILTAGGNG